MHCFEFINRLIRFLLSYSYCLKNPPLIFLRHWALWSMTSIKLGNFMRTHLFKTITAVPSLHLVQFKCYKHGHKLIIKDDTWYFQRRSRQEFHACHGHREASPMLASFTHHEVLGLESKSNVVHRRVKILLTVGAPFLNTWRVSWDQKEL